ncbi:MAG: hypothetical protein ABJE47_08900 [bacterium]
MLTYVALPVRGEGIPVTGKEALAFGKAWPIFERSMKRFARICTKDLDKQDDLLQEVMLTLWNQDPTRWDFTIDAHILYMNKMLIHRMHDAWDKDKNFREKAEDIPGEVRMDARRAEAEAGRALRTTLA